MVLQLSAKAVLWLLGSAILALIVAIVLAAVSVSGVTSMHAALTLLWIALSIFCLAMLATGILYCPTQPGGRAALIALALVGFVGAGWWGRSALAQWLVGQKTTQEAVAKVPKPPDPKPPLGHNLPSDAGKKVVPGIQVAQGGHHNTANPVNIPGNVGTPYQLTLPSGRPIDDLRPRVRDGGAKCPASASQALPRNGGNYFVILKVGIAGIASGRFCNRLGL